MELIRIQVEISLQSQNHPHSADQSPIKYVNPEKICCLTANTCPEKFPRATHTCILLDTGRRLFLDEENARLLIDRAKEAGVRLYRIQESMRVHSEKPTQPGEVYYVNPWAVLYIAEQAPMPHHPTATYVCHLADNQTELWLDDENTDLLFDAINENSKKK